MSGIHLDIWRIDKDVKLGLAYTILVYFVGTKSGTKFFWKKRGLLLLLFQRRRLLTKCRPILLSAGQTEKVSVFVGKKGLRHGNRVRRRDYEWLIDCRRKGHLTTLWKFASETQKAKTRVQRSIKNVGFSVIFIFAKVTFWVQMRFASQCPPDERLKRT